jgi:hypothetical protein
MVVARSARDIQALARTSKKSQRHIAPPREVFRESATLAMLTCHPGLQRVAVESELDGSPGELRSESTKNGKSKQ